VTRDVAITAITNTLSCRNQSRERLKRWPLGLARGFPPRGRPQVEIYEARRFAGGKVGSWVDKDGNHIEMGLHVFFG
jgi:hypothetical protein